MIAFALLPALLLGCRPAGSFSPKMSIEDVQTVCNSVCDWQIANYDRFPNGTDCFIADLQVHWTSGVLDIGMYKWAEWTDNDAAFDFLKGIGEANSWGLYTLRTPYHADDICIGQTYIEMARRYGDPSMLAATLDRASFIASNPSSAPLSKKDTIGRYDRWAWCDALFMAPPVYAALYTLTGEQKYSDYLLSEWKECTDSLFDPVEKLYYRDCIRRELREPNGKGEFWARGNAWVFAGIALTLENLPEDYEHRAMFEDIFKSMATSVAACQTSDGSWHPSLLDPEHFPTPETSSSSLFCYGLAWGIRHGLLERSIYYPVLKKGWKALCSHVHPDGKLGFVQPIGAFPQNGITEDDTQVYAVGGFLMAGSEICKLLSAAPAGKIKNKTLSQTDNDLTVGCETLDRDYADYHKYKEYLEPLALRKLRLQAGWAKTEKVKGEYDFAWLDSIIDDALSRGLVPWLQTSYGNPIYEGGGTIYLAGGWPTSQEAKDAWDNWVMAMAERYRGKVSEWEIWNEPDINKVQFRDVESFVELTERTARIIRSVDPDAKIAAFAFAYSNPEVFDKCLSLMQQHGTLDLIDWVTYHLYRYRPEDIYIETERLQSVLDKYSDRIVLRQGETGAPSSAGAGGAALADHSWTEVSQAKWDLRRMLGDKGRGIPTTVFTISDLHYSSADHIQNTNYKGLLETDDEHNVLRAKQAYGAVRNLATVWDEADEINSRSAVKPLSSRHHSLYCFTDSESGLDSFVLWHDTPVAGGNGAPDSGNKYVLESVEASDLNIKDPVALDLRTGAVYNLESSRSDEGLLTLRRVPVYDSPVFVIDRSLLALQAQSK